jgi:hypothetical protein
MGKYTRRVGLDVHAETQRGETGVTHVPGLLLPMFPVTQPNGYDHLLQHLPKFGERW